ncbi:MAG: hypothetical protein NT167_31730, partial [Verrucomicrobia bacterium]|nr:hypothetical protein [Verrucomicrobiota bacterium]
VLYWEMYNNEVTPDGRQRGFWLIDDHGVKQPVYFTHQKFYQQARAYVADFTTRNGHVPSREEFGSAALAWLPVETAPSAKGPLVQGTPFVDELRDFSKVFSHTDHLVFDGTNPGYFEGRPQRVVREGADQPRHFIYHGNGIVRFKITTYVFGGFAGTSGPKVRVFASADAQQWGAVDVGGETTATKEGWARVVRRPGGVSEDRTARRCCRLFAAGGQGAVVHGGRADQVVGTGAIETLIHKPCLERLLFIPIRASGA